MYREHPLCFRTPLARACCPRQEKTWSRCESVRPFPSTPNATTMYARTSPLRTWPDAIASCPFAPSPLPIAQAVEALRREKIIAIPAVHSLPTLNKLTKPTPIQPAGHAVRTSRERVFVKQHSGWFLAPLCLWCTFVVGVVGEYTNDLPLLFALARRDYTPQSNARRKCRWLFVSARLRYMTSFVWNLCCETESFII